MSTHHSPGITRLRLLFLLLFVMVALTGSMASGEEKINATIIPDALMEKSNYSDIPVSLPSTSSKATYNCSFRIFIVEPQSYRYVDYYGQGYQNGFLDLAINEELHIQESHSGTVVWDGTDSPGAEGGFNDLEESNIMAIAVIFNNDTYHEAYSDPPSAYPFNAYYVDAAAGATPGTHGSNVAINGTTHTSFVHECTANG